MAVLWQKKVKGTLYEVRTAGHTRRLYTNGVFHSQFNPNRHTAGGVWDLLILPVFFYPRDYIQRILVLGVGGGAIIRLLKSHVRPSKIVGIEHNAMHLSIARRFFGVRKATAQLIHADAEQWLNDYSGPPFDLIVDDLFDECDGEPVRAVALNSTWFERLYANLSRDGLLVVNTTDIRDFNSSAYFTSRRISGRFKSAFQLTLPLYENVVGAFLKKEATGKLLHNHLINDAKAPFLKNLGSSGYRVRRVV
ncbi:MAG: hypothetical protein BMS9Abin15_0246 [Gammaproteobacteria bacterium]|nr:MAG: hypothetical protein BMS9Abin15_0246 [Gammaproteobacteria bacterium]